MRVTFLHYSGPPTIGGVEQTIFHHARKLADLQFKVSVIVGTGETFDERVPVTVIPEAYSKNPDVLAVKAALDRGQVPRGFSELRSLLADALARALDDQQVLVVHNALTLHKNLALTAALWDLHASGRSPRLVGWHHDLAWDRPDYQHELHPGDPWELLCRPWPGAANVVVSRAQRTRLARIYGIDEEAIDVVPPGVDPLAFGRWTPLTCHIVESLDLLSADLLLLLPARITRRKNIEYALHVLEALRRSSALDCRLIVTGPPGAHNPTNVSYLAQLLGLRSQLGLDESAHFLFQLDGDTQTNVDQATLTDLYHLADALLFPSRDEGFGIPLLEAGLARLPVFCSDIPPFHDSGLTQVHYFPLEASPSDTAQLIMNELEADPSFALKHRVLANYTWDEIIRDRVVPLLERVAGG
jgi:glycosyltransferase involved in cell wall biosynthesis